MRLMRWVLALAVVQLCAWGAVATLISGCERELLPESTLVPTSCRNSITLEDTFDGDQGWSRTTEATPGFRDFVEFRASGGNLGGGYRHMTHVLAGRGSIVVSHVFGTAYEPRMEGAIGRIVYSEDRQQFDPPFAGAAVGSGFLAEQQGRRQLRQLPEFRETSWQHLEVDLAPSDLPGIDLSATGGPIRFGYYRANSDSSATVQHGIDNWKVVLCR